MNFLRIFLGYCFPIALETLIFAVANDIIDLFRPSLLVIFTGRSPLSLCKWTKCLPYWCHHWWSVGAAVRTVCDVKWIPVRCSLRGTLDFSFSNFPATGSSSRCEIMVLSLRAKVSESLHNCVLFCLRMHHTPLPRSPPQRLALGIPMKIAVSKKDQFKVLGNCPPTPPLS